MTSPETPPKRKSHNRLRKARANWFYKQRDVEELYGVCPNTIRNWMGYGLRSIKAKSRLFLGRDLNAHHKQRQADAKRPCKLDEIYCVCCKRKHSLRIEPFEIDEGSCRTRIIVVCPDTGGWATKWIGKTDLDELRHLQDRSSSPETSV